jgi:hypothetical protein
MCSPILKPNSPRGNLTRVIGHCSTRPHLAAPAGSSCGKRVPARPAGQSPHAPPLARSGVERLPRLANKEASVQDARTCVVLATVIDDRGLHVRSRLWSSTASASSGESGSLPIDTSLRVLVRGESEFQRPCLLAAGQGSRHRAPARRAYQGFCLHSAKYHGATKEDLLDRSGLPHPHVDPRVRSSEWPSIAMRLVATATHWRRLFGMAPTHGHVRGCVYASVDFLTTIGATIKETSR